MNRKLLPFGTCDWVHYAMIEEEKADLDGTAVRYHMSPREREASKAEFRQCLRCESPVSVLRQATDREVPRVSGHIAILVLI